MASADDPRSLPPRGRLLAPPVAICTGKVALLDWAAAGRRNLYSDASQANHGPTLKSGTE